MRGVDDGNRMIYLARRPRQKRQMDRGALTRTGETALART